MNIRRIGSIALSFILSLGLFAPRAGQNFRDEQRRRRSQYDRGTRLAEIEDSRAFNVNAHDDVNHALSNTSLSQIQRANLSTYEAYL